ncbi:MAG: YggS family pyridoxal phosphate-dependent enzyme, partial [Clostridiales bacterium]
WHPEREWHFIGHLQTNKVKYIADKVTCIHSLESLKLAAEIDKQGAKVGRVIPCLLEINMAEEESKFGLSATAAETFLRELAPFSHILPKGLMTVAPAVADPLQNRPIFCRMRQLLQQLQGLHLPNTDLTELSMGMSNDYAVAVEEGATVVRLGTTIFGKRNYNQKETIL